MTEPRHSLDRRITALAVPALGALVAEPVFTLIDSAMIGHLGAAPLAGLAAAASILQTAVGLMVFLAYAATPLVARRLGQGRPTEALVAGIDGLWLALLTGVALAVVGWWVADPLVAMLTPDAEVASHAHAYLRVSLFGLPAMLVVLAATGVLRGLQDTKTPLVVVAAGMGANVGLNAFFIYGLGWGVAGSALGTVVVQCGMGFVLAGIVVRRARAVGAGLRPEWAGVGRSMREGGWLFLRTATLRVALLATVWLAARLGTDTLAGYQVLFSLFSALGMAFDALAVAGQALVGLELGERERQRRESADARAPEGSPTAPFGVRVVSRRLQQWGVLVGAALTVVFVAASPWAGRAFTSDPGVLSMLTPGLIAMGVTLPLAGYVFVLDGILIGAGDGRYLALAGLLNLAGMAVWMAAVLWLLDGDMVADQWKLVAVWSCFGGGLMIMRALTLGLRLRGDRWVQRA
ncbi:MATE family efflux transporter [Pseudoclavibacter sp. CFCC 11306]|uniref:MATE family efflux transporter n=1 Tax=Pseudoclavibacter sp. CFCC 11306 TaxID=1564493 RepID=UPI0013014C6F|nr:MATE family efflux transporter [Pseudoclavibacter sp. CFCC 11306]KAB1657475.1 MATE family efflux transporter [Pseudoclavibacter sp. CFCC 11306]